MPQLPDGVIVQPLQAHPDRRGTFTEIFRAEWDTGVFPVQWNAVESTAGTLRGVHVHRRHDDYLLVLRGRASVGLRDLRPDSTTGGLAAVIELSSQHPRALVIPHGVAHGFYFSEPSLHVYSVTEYWHPDDELGCRWDDPALGIAWPVQDPILSARDAALPSLSELSEQLFRASVEST